MIFRNHIPKPTIQRLFGNAAEVSFSARRGRRHLWPVTVVSISYSAALKRLREVHGPTARFKREDQAGLESWSILTPSGVALVPGPADWAKLLANGLGIVEH